MSVTLAPIGAPANAPRPNWANVNARPIVNLLKPGADLLDGLEADEVAPALRRVLHALNVDGARAQMACEPRQEGRVFWGGSTDEQAQRRLREALDVLRYAAEHRTGVCWG